MASHSAKLNHWRHWTVVVTFSKNQQETGLTRDMGTARTRTKSFDKWIKITLASTPSFPNHPFALTRCILDLKFYQTLIFGNLVNQLQNMQYAANITSN